jgi:hypothetical protein
MASSFYPYLLTREPLQSSQIRDARWYLYLQIKKPHVGYILEGLGMENVGIFYDHLIHILPFGIYLGMRKFGILCGHLVYFSRFGKLFEDKSGNPIAIIEHIFVE